jgi:hypothetical protein
VDVDDRIQEAQAATVAAVEFLLVKESPPVFPLDIMNNVAKNTFPFVHVELIRDVSWPIDAPHYADFGGTRYPEFV